MANRTTNERFSRSKKSKKSSKTGDEDEDQEGSEDEEDGESEATSSIMTISDFESSLIESGKSKDSKRNSFQQKKKHARKRKGCCINIWKMSTHTTIVPQKKLYNYLAEQSMILEDSEIDIEPYKGNTAAASQILANQFTGNSPSE